MRIIRSHSQIFQLLTLFVFVVELPALRALKAGAFVEAADLAGLLPLLAVVVFVAQAQGVGVFRKGVQLSVFLLLDALESLLVQLSELQALLPGCFFAGELSEPAFLAGFRLALLLLRERCGHPPRLL